MNRQQITQAARKKAMEGQESRRRDRAAQERRLEARTVDVLVAVAERDEAIQNAEQRAGVAVSTMQGEGLSASEIAHWCGDGVSAREVRRLPQGSMAKASRAQDVGPGVARAADGGRVLGARSIAR